MGNSFLGTPPVRKTFSIRMVNSQKLSFSARFRKRVNNIYQSFYIFPQFPLGNALCYSTVKLNKNSNRTKLNITSKTHFNVYNVYIYIIYAWLCIDEQNDEHLAYTSQTQQQIASFKQNASIIVSISIFFNWVPHENLDRTTAAGHEQITNK